MNSEKWQQIKDLFRAALECNPEERTAFLKKAGENNEEIREEVESLLAADAKASSFIERPAIETAAQLLTSDCSQSLVKRNIAHYRIEAIAGAGGMGDVYLAHDTKLGRKVALKVLPANFNLDEDLVLRFKQEACATSVLNHPNILTIYEIGQIGSMHFIAAEFVQGETLGQRMLRTEISLWDSVNIVSQVASALAAAHKVGIIHRDIKPENIMLRPDGYVKVLDFGIAKILEQSPIFDEQEIALAKTHPGILTGTPSYMSPEQVQGLSIDGRADLFSLGVVFYELITGNKPFQGSTRSKILTSILEDDPSSTADFRDGMPSEVQRIIAKMLCKDREQRYLTAEDLLDDVNRLKYRLESGNGVKAVNTSAQLLVETPKQLEYETGIASPDTTSFINGLLRLIKSRKAVVITSLTLIAALIILIIGVYKPAREQLTEDRDKALSQKMTIDKITNMGKANRPSISPDGKYIAYVVNDSKNQSLWVRHVATSRSIQIIGPSDISYEQLTFSPDSNYIYYVKGNPMVHENQLFVIPVLGGTQKKLIRDVGISFALSPDGKQVAFTRFSDDQEDIYLMTVNVDGSSEEVIITKRNGWLDCPAWSPDGKKIAFTSGEGELNSDVVNIVEIFLDQRTRRIIGSLDRSPVNSLIWRPDSSGLLFVANCQIWNLHYPDGELQKVTNDLNTYTNVSLTADSSTLCAEQSNLNSGIWIAPGGEMDRAKQITFGDGDGVGGLSWSSSDKIVYVSGPDIWIMDSDGDNQKQLTLNSGRNIFPSVSPDGRHIFFSSDRKGAFNIWMMDLDGANPTQLTSGSGEHWPQYSPSDQMVVFESVDYEATNPKAPILWKVSINGGAPIRLVKGSQPVISPDGKLLAFYHFQGIAILPLAGEKFKNIIDIPFFRLMSLGDFRTGLPIMRMPLMRWTADSNALTYVADQAGLDRLPSKPSIWIQPVSGGPPKIIGEYDGDVLLSWSSDGKQLAFRRANSRSDIIQIKNFQ